MKKALLSLALAVTMGVPASLAWGDSGEGLRLSRGGDAPFPQRSFVLTLPGGMSADPTDVKVLENGEPVRELLVTTPGAASDAAPAFGTVLAIDASNSMRGGAIKKAMRAARTFASHRQPSQTLGIVTFNRKGRTVLEPTSDSALIESALAEDPPLAKQTHLRDGVIAALDALEGAHVTAGSVIVLSDGADTGSRATVGDVAAAAREQGVRVFTVGLNSPDFDEETLQRIARAGMAEHISAPRARDLDRIYDDLGAQLSGEYLIDYTSIVRPGRTVVVEATVSGVPGSATVKYTSPKLGAASLPQPERKAGGFWGSAAAMIVVGFGSAFLVCFGLAWIFMERRRTETAEERVAAFVSIGAPDRPELPDTSSDKLYERLERSLKGHKWWQKFRTDVEIAEIQRKPAQIAVVMLLGTAVLMWCFSAISGAKWAAVFALLLPWGVQRFVAHRATKRRVAFGEQLADNLQVVASAMRSGQSFAGALAVAVEDAAEPAKSEFQRVVADEQLGVPIETAIGVIVDRMQNNDLHQVALVASLQREAGGNAAEVLERVAETIRERVALRRLISSLTAQGRMSRWVVSLIPVALIMYLAMVSPEYLNPLFETTAGNVLVVISALMGITGSFVIKKIVDIRV